MEVFCSYVMDFKKTDLGIDLIANAFERRYKTQAYF